MPKSKHRWHLENYLRASTWGKAAIKGLCLFAMGSRNALQVKVLSVKIPLSNLPTECIGKRILFISDLHIDGMPELLPIIANQIRNLTYDICILGGDYRYYHRGSVDIVLQYMSKLIAILREKSPVYGILGNHDEYAIAEKMCELGVRMLLNEAVQLFESSLYLIGLDDCHYYGADDLKGAMSQLPSSCCKILVCHSPELFKEAAAAQIELYIAGHTHGGQICLPGGISIVSNAKTPYSLKKGRWEWQQMRGYTSKGVGCSMLPVRFYCPPEITLITLDYEGISSKLR